MLLLVVTPLPPTVGRPPAGPMGAGQYIHMSMSCCCSCSFSSNQSSSYRRLLPPLPLDGPGRRVGRQRPLPLGSSISRLRLSRSVSAAAGLLEGVGQGCRLQGEGHSWPVYNICLGSPSLSWNTSNQCLRDDLAWPMRCGMRYAYY